MRELPDISHKEMLSARPRQSLRRKRERRKTARKNLIQKCSNISQKKCLLNFYKKGVAMKIVMQELFSTILYLRTGRMRRLLLKPSEMPFRKKVWPLSQLDSTRWARMVLSIVKITGTNSVK